MRLAVAIDASGIAHGPPGGPPVPWWSFTKTVIAIACFRGAEAGVLDLDEPAWPGGRSTRQLLRHEAGLPDYGGWADYHAAVAAGRRPWPVSRIIRRGVAALGPAGGWSYSNIGYAIAAMGLAEKAGRPLADLLTTWVLGPAGAASARLATTSEDLKGAAGIAAGYDPGWVYHGLMVGELADAARVARTLLAGELLAPRSLGELLRPTALAQYGTAVWPDAAYGAGVMLPRRRDGRSLVGHTGSGPGSSLAVYAETAGDGATAAAVFDDSGADVEHLVTDLFQTLPA
jgi:D-alanyl-D-alanine carboxypeptidase